MLDAASCPCTRRLRIRLRALVGLRAAQGPGSSRDHDRAGHRRRALPRTPPTDGRGLGARHPGGGVLLRGGGPTPGGAPPGAARSGATWLYFGCRREEEDYLYREELEAHLAEGTLTRLRLAFSRAQAAKVYVQHLLREDGAELWEMLQRGGHVYICGGTLMGRDVVEALSAAVARHGALGAEGAAKYLKEMEAAGRLVKELWS